MTASVVRQTLVNVDASRRSDSGPFVSGVTLTIPRTRSVNALMLRHAASVVRLALVDVHATVGPEPVPSPARVALASPRSRRVCTRRL